MLRIIIITILMALLWGTYFHVRMAYPSKVSDNKSKSEQVHLKDGFDKPPPPPTAPETKVIEN